MISEEQVKNRTSPGASVAYNVMAIAYKHLTQAKLD